MAEKNAVAEDVESVYDSNDVELVNARKAAAGRKQKRLEDFTVTVMASQIGREWIWELLARCGVHRTSFSTDALVMAFKEGTRNVGLQTEAELTSLCPQEFAKMHQEAKIRERAEVEREKRLKENQDG